MFPFLAGASGLLALIFFFLKVDVASIPMLALTVVLGVGGLVAPGKEHPASGRVYAVLAMLMAAMPFLAQGARALRVQHLQAARSKETAGMYAQLERDNEATGKWLTAYIASHRLVPEMLPEGAPALSFLGSGKMGAPPPFGEFKLADDPFKPGLKLRWCGVPEAGALLVSVGQDGVPELALPGPALDPPPANPMGRFAATGQDMRLATYDPTNGAIGLGDIVRWHGPLDQAKVFEPLHAAWDRAAKRSPDLPPPEPGAPPPADKRQSHHDARGAIQLFAEGDDLAAAALASRSFRMLPGSRQTWSGEEAAVGRIRGIALYNLGCYRLAADALAAHLQGTSEDGEAHFYMAAASYIGGDAGAALRHFVVASQTDADKPRVEAALANVERLRRNEPPDLPRPRSMGAAGP